MNDERDWAKETPDYVWESFMGDQDVDEFIDCGGTVASFLREAPLAADLSDAQREVVGDILRAVIDAHADEHDWAGDAMNQILSMEVERSSRIPAALERAIQSVESWVEDQPDDAFWNTYGDAAYSVATRTLDLLRTELSEQTGKEERVTMELSPLPNGSKDDSGIVMQGELRDEMQACLLHALAIYDDWHGWTPGLDVPSTTDFLVGDRVDDGKRWIKVNNALSAFVNGGRSMQETKVRLARLLDLTI